MYIYRVFDVNDPRIIHTLTESLDVAKAHYQNRNSVGIEVWSEGVPVGILVAGNYSDSDYVLVDSSRRTWVLSNLYATRTYALSELLESCAPEQLKSVLKLDSLDYEDFTTGERKIFFVQVTRKQELELSLC